MSSCTVVARSPILGLPIVSYPTMDDPRGPFLIPFDSAALEPELAVEGHRFGPSAQTNISVTTRAGTARGGHVSAGAKYCTAITGGFFNPVADLRPDSPTYGQVEQFELVPGTALLVPPGCANFVQAQTDGAVYAYWLNRPYAGAEELVVSGDELPIKWPLAPERRSPKDLAGLTLVGYSALMMMSPDELVEAGRPGDLVDHLRYHDLRTAGAC